MYALLRVLLPLKVLIFYDYDEWSKLKTQNHTEWLDEKFASLFSLGKAVRDAWPESEDSKYDFLVGNRLD